MQQLLKDLVKEQVQEYRQVNLEMKRQEKLLVSINFYYSNQTHKDINSKK